MAAPQMVKTNLRIPLALKAQLEEKAVENRRSLNQEMRVALERHVRGHLVTLGR
jgi:predicted HicB family RNase H-like nuclease